MFAVSMIYQAPLVDQAVDHGSTLFEGLPHLADVSSIGQLHIIKYITIRTRPTQNTVIP